MLVAATQPTSVTGPSRRQSSRRVTAPWSRWGSLKARLHEDPVYRREFVHGILVCQSLGRAGLQNGVSASIIRPIKELGSTATSKPTGTFKV